MSQVGNTILHRLLLVLLVLAPLPLGSNREWSWTLLSFLVAVITLVWVLRSFFRPQRVSTVLKLPVIVLFLIVPAWAWLQTVAWLPAGWQHPLWDMSAAVPGPLLAGAPVSGSISLSAQDSLMAAMRLLSYGLVFFLAFQFGRDRAKALLTFKCLALAAVVYALYGLIIFWGQFGTLFWFFDEGFKADVRGTFVDRNSFATYLGLTLLLAIAVFHQQVAGRRRSPMAVPRGRELRIEQFILQVWQPLIVILLLTTALILTHSRGGFFSTLAGGLVLLWLLYKRQQFHSAKSTAVLGGTVLVAVLAFVLTSEVSLQRIDRLTVDSSARVEVYGLSQAIEDNPLLGFGYGTFTDSFRLYRDDHLAAHFDKTDNIYLENIFELGWPAAATLFLLIGWVSLRCLQGAFRRGRDWVYPATGVAATVLVAIHSLLNFSLQMPAIAVTYAAILGVAFAQSYSSRTG